MKSLLKLFIYPVQQKNIYGGFCELFAISKFSFELQKQNDSETNLEEKSVFIWAWSPS